MTDHLTTLAEIQRFCIKIWDQAEDTGPKGVHVNPLSLNYTQIPHPSPNFTIHTDGMHYVVRDGDSQALYKLRSSEQATG